ncbi:MAG: hypothetical protein HYV52_00540 [Parcubacteria group bacterium]|nr:hypothetical protein [Parcubacteria group bacterium]
MVSEVEPSTESIYFDAIFAFLFALLATLFITSLWAKIFVGSWFGVDFQNEFPNILILSTLIALIAVIWPHFPECYSRKILLFGFSIIALEVFTELPLKKYIAVYPQIAASITPWFFLFGIAEFVGISLALSGFYLLLIHPVRSLTTDKGYTEKKAEDEFVDKIINNNKLDRTSNGARIIK